MMELVCYKLKGDGCICIANDGSGPFFIALIRVGPWKLRFRALVVRRLTSMKAWKCVLIKEKLDLETWPLNPFSIITIISEKCIGGFKTSTAGVGHD